MINLKSEPATNYRLVWFQHFHKSAGTTIVSLAKKNGESLYPNHRNGNPVDLKGDYIPIWALNGRELTEFIDSCEQLGCTFLGPAWGVGDLQTLHEDPRVMIVTCVRDPFSRFVSNFVFDYRLGYTQHRDIRNYVGSKRSFSHFNYYTIMLARIGETSSDLSQADFDRAKKMLDYFHYIGIVGATDWLASFCNAVGWKPFDIQANQRKNALLEILRHMGRGRVKVAKRIFDSSRLTVDVAFETKFKDANLRDYEVFHLASARHSKLVARI